MRSDADVPGRIEIVHILWTRKACEWRGRKKCPTCSAARRYVAYLEEWHGITETCLGCGDRWQNGERCPRPFERGWRQKAIAKAKKEWPRLPGRRAAYEAYWKRTREAESKRIRAEQALDEVTP